MADTPFPSDPRTAEQLLRFTPLPPGDDGEPVLAHAEMQAALHDVQCSRDAIATLARLLAQAGPLVLEAPEQSANGLATLLDGLRCRMDLAVDSLQGLTYQLMHPASPETH